MQTVNRRSIDFVSVLMPVYNGEKYLSEAIESVLGQTYRNFELIIINDHSTDRTAEIIKSFSDVDARVRGIDNPGPGGLVNALNFGIVQTKASWIARFDADDVCHPERLASQVNFLQNNIDVAILGTAFQMFGSQQALPLVRHPKHPLEVAWKFSWNTRLGHPTVIFNKEVILRYGGYPRINAEDFALFSKVSQEYRVSNLSRVLLSYRWHGENKSFLERESIGKNVYEITSQLLKTYGVPEELHEHYVHMHWHMSCPRKTLIELLRWNLKIIFQVRNKLGYQKDIYANCFLIPKFALLLMFRVCVQIKLRMTRYVFKNVFTP